jgi:hypothetical protein
MAGSLRTVANELAKWQYKRSEGTRVAVSQQTVTHLSMKVVKSRRMGLADHVAHLVGVRNFGPKT